MKTSTLLFLSVLSLIGCTGEQNKTKKSETLTLVSEEVPIHDISLHPGLISLQNNDCFSCHDAKVDRVGPSFQKIVSKYPFNSENKTYLVEKIKKGGSGVWGTIPMNSHETLAENEVEEMLAFIYEE
jgi:cytochrome c